jgi:hypothetical protein
MSGFSFPPFPSLGLVVTGADIRTIVVVTQAEYDAIAEPAATTLYVIVG